MSIFKKIKQLKKSLRITIYAITVIAILVLIFLFKQYTYFEKYTVKPTDEFRNALSVSPFTETAFKKGYTYEINGKKINSVEELEQAYINAGATEMYTRIGTKRYTTDQDITYGKPDPNANVHTFTQGIELCKIAAKLNIPINPEIMCAYTYMDMEANQAPNFKDYPEIYELQRGKKWEELSLDEICTVLNAYGTYVAKEILKTGCTVNCWNMGNEANYGFAGVSVGLKNAVNPKLENVPTWIRYILPTFGTSWLENNVWKYNARQFTALQDGILKGYKELGIDSRDVKFSTHIATVASTPSNAAAYFNTMKKYGYKIDVAGISYYPSAPSASLDSEVLYKKVISEIYTKCKLPIFIAEFSYPSGKMSGSFAGWSKECKGYPMNEEGQDRIYKDTIEWGKKHGLIGMRYWAPDYEGWSSMSMFNFKGKVGTPKKILKDILQNFMPV